MRVVQDDNVESIVSKHFFLLFYTAFVTKLNDDVDAAAGEVMAASGSNGDFTAHSSRAVQRMTSQLSIRDKKDEVVEEDASDAESEEQYEFDVYEREGYDKIMRTVAYGNDDDDEFARQICDVLEVFESLCPGRFVWFNEYRLCAVIVSCLCSHKFCSCLR